MPFLRKMTLAPDTLTPEDARAAIGKTLEDRFTFLLTQLKVGGTRAVCQQYAPFVPTAFPSAVTTVNAGAGPEDVTGLSD